MKGPYGSPPDAPDAITERLITVLITSFLFIATQIAKSGVADILTSPDKFAILCYTSVYCLYLFYLSKYYKEIWKVYYSDKGDSVFFNFYALALVATTAIGVMWEPKYWGLYITASLFILYFKKRATRNGYMAWANGVFTDKYGITVGQASDLKGWKIPDGDKHIEIEEEDRRVVCQALLSESFTNNFLIWGVFVFGAASGLLAYFSDQLIAKVILDGWFTSFHATSLGVLFVVIFFFLLKILGGIERILNQIEAGECRGLTAVFRSPFK